MKNKTIIKNILAMFALSVGFTYYTITFTTLLDREITYALGFILGRAITSPLLSLIIIYLPVLLLRGRESELNSVFYSIWWLLFLILNALFLLPNFGA